MKQQKDIERYVEQTEIETDAERHSEILQGILKTHAAFKKEASQERQHHIWRIDMKRRGTRIAAAAAIVVLLVGVLQFGTGSVALSQVTGVMRSSLTQLRDMILGLRTNEPPVERRALPLPRATDNEGRPQYTGPVIMSETRIVSVPQEDDAIRNLLAEYGVELVQAATETGVSYATLAPGQIDQVLATDGVKILFTPRIPVGDGQEAALATAGCGVAVEPSLRDDGSGFDLTFSFHNGESGFEIPDISIEMGQALLIYARGIALVAQYDDDGDRAAGHTLILVEVSVQ